MKPAQFEAQEPAGWRPATFHRDNLTFNPGLPDEQTVKFWKLQGVEIEYCYTSPPQRKPDNEAYTALEQALTRLQKRYGELEAKVAAQQQPVGKWTGIEIEWIDNPYKFKQGQLIYTTPPQHKPLTDDEIIGWVESGEYNVITNDWASHIEFARAIEAAHGIKE